MVFGNRKSEHCNININGVEIAEVTDTKFLGVIIDNKLKWHTQIQNVQRKIAKSVSILYRVKHLLDSNALLMIYNSLLLPYLNYCVEVWGNTYPTNPNCIKVLQKKAIRILGNLDYNDHTNSVFLEFKLLKFDDIVKLNTGTVMYKAFNNLLNERLRRCFTVNSTKTRQYMNFFVQFKRMKLKSFSISCSGVSLWNSLDISVRSCKSVILFKKAFKKILISQHKNIA